MAKKKTTPKTPASQLTPELDTVFDTLTAKLLESGAFGGGHNLAVSASTELVKRLYEAMLEGEMRNHMKQERASYDAHMKSRQSIEESEDFDDIEAIEEAVSSPRRNRRCGYSTKRVKGLGESEVELKIPRDRLSNFEPQLVTKHTRTLTPFDNAILNLYANGMSTREICDFVEKTYNYQISPDKVSDITDSILEAVRAWRTRELHAFYPVVFLDAIHIKIRRNGAIRSVAVHLAIGVDTSGTRDVLGFWLTDNESASFWHEVLTELQNRGVEDILMIVSDGLKGLPETIEKAFPKTVHQTCIVHLVRNSVAYVNYKDKKEICSRLRDVYTAVNAEDAQEKLMQFARSELGQKYPRVIRIWEAAWQRVIPFFDYPPAVRKMIYTTNMIENLNRNIRKNIKVRGSFPTEDAAFKCIWLVIQKSTEKWSRSMHGWASVMYSFETLFGERFIKHTDCSQPLIIK